MAVGASSFNVAVREKDLFFCIVGLGDGFFENIALLIEGGVDLFDELLIFGAVGAVVVVKFNEKTAEIVLMFALGFVDELFWGDAFFFSAQHDGRAVCVVGANVVGFMTA